MEIHPKSSEGMEQDREKGVKNPEQGFWIKMEKRYRSPYSLLSCNCLFRAADLMLQKAHKRADQDSPS